MRAAPTGQYPQEVTDQRTVALLTLGCARNDVDADELAATLTRDGYRVVADPESDGGSQADVVVVNTCGFVTEAKQESINAILSAAGDGRPVVAVGCLAERYGRELAGELPEAAAVVGFDGYKSLGDTIARVLAGESVPSHEPIDRRTLLPITPVKRPDLSMPPGHATPVSVDLPGTAGRRRLRSGPVAPIKIASGCDRRCAFCAIPRFRGAFVSRRPTDIVTEAAWLAADEGVREIILVSENSTSYGKDLGDPRLLESVLPALADIPELHRIRVSYLQPAETRPTLVTAMAHTGKVAPYFDLSFQHASGPLLRRMRRFGDAESFLQLISSVREQVPDAGIRTNVIVGFPGETAGDLEVLEQFLADAELDAVGVFGYSDEDGTEGATLDGQVDRDEIADRVGRIAELADTLTGQRAARRIGQRAQVLIEQVEAATSTGRSGFQGPDDGETTIAGEFPVGSLVDVVITGSVGVDVVAEVVDT